MKGNQIIFNVITKIIVFDRVLIANTLVKFSMNILNLNLFFYHVISVSINHMYKV